MYWTLTVFYLLIIMKWQLVQFLLKQAGVDKRTGDLYGKRDLLNIARNMARGLKVWAKKPSMLIPLIFFNPYLVTYRLYFHLCLGRWKCIHPAPASPVSNYGKHNERADERCGLPFCWDSLSTGKVGSIKNGKFVVIVLLLEFDMWSGFYKLMCQIAHPFSNCVHIFKSKHKLMIDHWLVMMLYA